ncbi:MAG: stage III sporulation protein AF [Eubacteriales bacterium]|nr:stage III sporulation protein AF [Eubacteriales bacterium]
MSSYFFCILIASVLSAICSSLASGGLEKYVKYVCSLICAVAVIMPVVAVFNGDIDTKLTYSVEANEYSTGDYISAEAEKKVREYIKHIVYEKFGITVQDISIEIYSGDGEVVVGNTTVTLKESDGEHVNEVRDFLLETLGGSVEVVISD